MAIKPVPDGYRTVTPYLIISGAAEALEFYKRALNATEVMRLGGPEGKVGHAEIQVGDSRIMLADEFQDMGFRSPHSLGGAGISLMLYVEDADKLFAQAIAAGAIELRPVKDQFYGDRSGTLRDPFGHVWTLATHIEDVTVEEVHRRAEACFKSPPNETP